MWRLLVHRHYARAWESLADRVDQDSAQQLHDHVPATTDRPPRVGTSGMLRGNHNKGKSGWSTRIHYEVTGAGQIDYEYHATYRVGAKSDKQPVVRILRIELGSH